MADMTAQRARRVIPGGVNSAQRQLPGLSDLVIVASAGARLMTVDGREILDFHGAYGPPLLGHNDPDVDRAVASAAQTIDNPGVGVTNYEIELAERIVELVPSVEQVLFTSTGSEATFHAVRLSRTVTGRRNVVKFQGCYHGWHDSLAMNVISPADKIGQKDPLSRGILPEVVDATIVLPFNDVAALEATFDEQGDTIAAVILEPVPHNIGCVLPHPEFLAAIRRLCTDRGAVMVFDEVITGFRHAIGGYQSICGVTPDLTTMGKAFANGYPISAIGGRAELMREFSTSPGQPAFFAGTFNGHPVMAAAACATIDKLVNEPVHDHIYQLGDKARTGLTEVFSSLDVEAFVTGFGSIFVSFFMNGPVDDYRDLLRNDVDLFTGYRVRQVDMGVLEVPLNLKRSNMSYAHTDADVDRLLETTHASVAAHLADRRR